MGSAASTTEHDRSSHENKDNTRPTTPDYVKNVHLRQALLSYLSPKKHEKGFSMQSNLDLLQSVLIDGDTAIAVVAPIEDPTAFEVHQFNRPTNNGKKLEINEIAELERRLKPIKEDNKQLDELYTKIVQILIQAGYMQTSTGAFTHHSQNTIVLWPGFN
tara:strand:- start:401 stop:880 length:480 start_codon:yes stop_codon:yes gene_type:complete